VVITTAVITPTPTPRWSGSTTSPGRWRLTGPWPAPYPTWALIYARTRHTTSRAGDPAPHDHIMVTNCCEMLAGEEWVQGLDSAALQKVVGGGHDGRPPTRCGQGPVVGLRTRSCVQGVWPTCRRWATSLGLGVATEQDGSTWWAQPPVRSGGWVQGGITFEQQSTPTALLGQGAAVGRYLAGVGLGQV
jgi:TrwC relaxase